MANDTRADEVAEKQPQQEPMPSSEQKSAEPTETEVEANAAPVEETEDSGLSKDRTSEQFEKLVESNKALKEKLEQYEKVSVNPSTTLGQQPQLDQQEADISSFYDPNTGEVDIKALTELEKAVKTAREDARAAKLEIQRSKDETQEREAEVKYPEFKTNSDLRKKARAVLLDSMLNPQDYGNKEISLVEAIEMIKTPTDKDVKDAEKKGADEALEKLSDKEQAALEATGRSDKRRLTSESIADLQERTRHGDLQATIDRIKGLPEA